MGRADDMVVVRGVNVFPSSLEAIVREISGSAEFQIVVTRREEMDQLTVNIELSEADAKRLAELFRDRLALRVDVQAVPPNSLPRFEAKANRLVDRRDANED